ncbi:methyltransferase (TIGR00027 family) [Amycolatopsis bartoniae]|uniref:S-adenosyl-L-methionine-dependent methyltransferase n=1 Tax=Amycolatopsis bartoniae TaxID=941986 RepID=A0A8H9IZ37_9PSEU|nr:SAM-dependent methyltransferase [Amycolatopsis bartoniae]MBB2936561.1 methyltransferase (TIGR00027 family) [Amycolatopsis bartoniae]GHF68057.1 putative S-adenosyl-L-methionine-dependent methyltransferase [Amycolatopsis bartoniae]
MSSAELAEGVSTTALMIAATRAIESHRPDGLVRDEYAEHFVRRARSSVAMPTRIEDVDGGDAHPVWGRVGAYCALRTRVFDDAVRAASSPQVVLLGAGLDTRALRLDLPETARVFEIDRADVLAFKLAVLDAVGATARVRCDRLVADLADAWDVALLDAGFSVAQPTTWIAEGVLPYLPPPVEMRVLGLVDRLSAPGSHIGYEVVPGQESAEFRDHELYAGTGDAIGSHLPSLLDDKARPDSAGVLRAAGWEITERPVADYTVRYGRGPDPSVDDPIQLARWGFGQKKSRSS